MINLPFGRNHSPWPWTHQSTENRKAQKQKHSEVKGYGKGENENGDRTADVCDKCCRKAQKPTTTDGDVSDSDPSALSQPAVGDGVNHSQVALHAGQEVKQRLSHRVDKNQINTNRHQQRETRFGATDDDDGPQDPQDLYGNHVVGDEVGVAGGHVGTLPPPSLETLVDDEDAEREDHEAACDGEADQGIIARSRA